MHQLLLWRLLPVRAVVVRNKKAEEQIQQDHEAAKTRITRYAHQMRLERVIQAEKMSRCASFSALFWVPGRTATFEAVVVRG